MRWRWLDLFKGGVSGGEKAVESGRICIAAHSRWGYRSAGLRAAAGKLARRQAIIAGKILAGVVNKRAWVVCCVSSLFPCYFYTEFSVHCVPYCPEPYVGGSLRPAS